MTVVNRGFCFWCGVPVGPNDYAYVGPNTVFVCDAKECNDELARDQREAAEEEEADQALRNRGAWY